MDRSAFIAASLFVAAALPLLGAAIGLFGRNSRRVNAVVQAMNIVAGLSAIAGAGSFLLGQGLGALSLDAAGQLPLAPYLPFLPVGSAAVDSLSAFFLLIIGIGTALASWFSIAYLPRRADDCRFPWLHLATGLFISGMAATVLAGSAAGFLFAWEIMSFAGYFLVIADRQSASLKAGLSYAAMTQFGAVCLIAGFAIYARGDLFRPLSELGSGLSPALAIVAFFLAFVGFAAKAGIFPLHEWLPVSYSQAPSSATALMSSVTPKVVLYGLLRVLSSAAHFDLPFWAALAIIAVGLFSGVFGALKAATETDIKRALAWSSVENLGLMFAMAGTVIFFMSIGAYGQASIVWIALLVHALNHAVFKNGLFMAAGSVIVGAGVRDADLLGGLAKKWPAFSALFLGLALAAAALPPLGTFYGEWLFLQTLSAGIGTSGILTALILGVIISAFALASGLAVFAFVKLFAGIFLSKPRSERAESAAPLPKGLVAPVGAALALSLGLGLALPAFMKAAWPAGEGSIFSGWAVASGDQAIWPLAVAAFLAAGIVAALIARRAFMRRETVITDTWGCGAPLTSRMEYTALAFAAPVRFFFRSLTLPWKKVAAAPVSPENPWICSRSLEHGESPIAERFVYRPIAKLVGYLAGKIKRLQNGVVQFYIALIFVALIVTLIVAL